MTDSNIENYCESFDPIIDTRCKVMILGSVPGAEGLRRQQYYAYKYNDFWSIIFMLFNKPFSENYKERQDILLTNNIALWDVIKNCERKGSSDTEIKNPVINDFETIFRDYPDITHVFFNGKKAESLFQKHAREISSIDRLLFHVLPSTSPANRTISYNEKLEKWSAILSPISCKQ